MLGALVGGGILADWLHALSPDHGCRPDERATCNAQPVTGRLRERRRVRAEQNEMRRHSDALLRLSVCRTLSRALVPAACCLLHVVCYVLSAACCLLHVACYVLSAGRLGALAQLSILAGVPMTMVCLYGPQMQSHNLPLSSLCFFAFGLVASWCGNINAIIFAAVRLPCTSGVQHATCNVHLPCNMQHATCNMRPTWHATRSEQHATSICHATCSMQRTPCSLHHVDL
jgi:hypothetical protein